MENKNIEKTIAVGFIALILVLGAGLVNELTKSDTNERFAGTPTNRFISATNDVAQVGKDIPSRILTGNSGRQYVAISATSTPVFCGFSATATYTAHTGVLINASSTYEVDQDNLYPGDITCVTAPGHATASVGLIYK